VLEKPNFPDEKIIACLESEFGLRIVELSFLPLGGDLGTAVYRAVGADGAAYFCKLRRGEFDEATVALPRLLSDQGIAQIIPPQRTRSGRLWAVLEEFNVILYPFVDGINGYDIELTEQQWADFGAAFKQIHATAIPAEILRTMTQEQYDPEWRTRCRAVMQRLAAEAFTDPIMAELVEFLQPRRELILDAIGRAEHFAAIMAESPLESVLCHSDLHAGNVFVGTDGAVYIVDWDYPAFAPKERDLMFIGGGQGYKPNIAEQEERLFYRGYGPARLDPVALTYYRYERGITEIAVEAERILSTTLGSQDRAQSLQYMKWYFLPGTTLEMARKSDPAR
jgi:spectinomycin phosphotransferase